MAVNAGAESAAISLPWTGATACDLLTGQRYRPYQACSPSRWPAGPAHSSTPHLCKGEIQHEILLYLITVTDMDRSKAFYHDLLGLNVEVDFGANVTLTGGIALQTADTWTGLIQKPSQDLTSATTPVSSTSRPGDLTLLRRWSATLT